jgi:hypothetical protein
MTMKGSLVIKRLLACTVLALAMTGGSAAPASADVNCSAFSTQAAAQHYMNAHPGDPDGLDGNDHDGRACESLPCPCYYGSDTGSTPVPPPPPADTDGDGVPDPNDACPTVAAAPPTGCPPPPDTDGDGLTDDIDDCPTVPADTEDGCPPPPRFYVGAIGSEAIRWTDRLQKPRELVPCSGSGACRVIRTKWRRWGKAIATGRGIARINRCVPTCADGNMTKTRGARVRAYRLRAGFCNGNPVSYYTRVRITWPRRLHLPRMTLKLTRLCG